MDVLFNRRIAAISPRLDFSPSRRLMARWLDANSRHAHPHCKLLSAFLYTPELGVFGIPDEVPAQSSGLMKILTREARLGELSAMAPSVHRRLVPASGPDTPAAQRRAIPACPLAESYGRGASFTRCAAHAEHCYIKAVCMNRYAGVFKACSGRGERPEHVVHHCAVKVTVDTVLCHNERHDCHVHDFNPMCAINFRPGPRSSLTEYSLGYRCIHWKAS
jgi:hypothetical protein